jgi:hypothetical protein
MDNISSISSIFPYSSAALLSTTTGPFATQSPLNPNKINSLVEGDGGHDVSLPVAPDVMDGLLNVTA